MSDPLAGLLGATPAPTRPARRAPLVPRIDTRYKTDGSYIVGVEGERSMAPVVIIRQVKPTSCAHTLSKREAWEFAQRRAEPVKATASAIRRYPASIEFMDLDGNRKLIQEATR